MYDLVFDEAKLTCACRLVLSKVAGVLSGFVKYFRLFWAVYAGPLGGTTTTTLNN